MARYSGLLTLGANTAAGFLDACWTFLDGNTDGGWTWARQQTLGVTTAVYGFRDYGSGGTAVRRVVWLCGDAAGSTPGLLVTDTAGAEKVYTGSARVSAGSFAWAGWTDAAPVGAGGVGRVYGIVTAGAGTAVKTEVYLGDMQVIGRLEGNNVASTTRWWRGGAMNTALSTARGGAADADPDGRRTGGQVSGLTTAIAAAWTNAAFANGVFGFQSTTNGQSHSWCTVSNVATDAQCRAPHFPLVDSLYSGGEIRPAAVPWTLASGGRLIGYDTSAIGNCLVASATKELSAGGVPLVYLLCRDSGATSCEAVGFLGAEFVP